nr:putative primase [Yersinia phage Rostov 43]
MNFWREYGEKLRVNGYTVIPIYAPDADKKGAGKRPIGKDWERTINDKEQIEGWAKKFTNNGIGILTKYTPAVDIDVYDIDASLYMAGVIEKMFGEVPCRIGKKPKRLYLFSCLTPFSKVKSGVWEDDFGQQHAVEILADGQQFVAYGIHPDTKKEYHWTDGNSPVENAAEFDLIDIDLDKAREITAAFDEYAKEQGWTMVRRPSNGMEAIGSADDDDWAAMAGINKWDKSYDELRDLVMRYPNPEDYDNWVKVLAALQVSCRDQDEAKEIAREWSAQADNFDESDFEYKWDKGFTHSASRLVTIASIIKEVKDEDDRIAEEKRVEYAEAFAEVTSLVEWSNWAESFKKEPVFGIPRRSVMDVAAKSYARISGNRLVVSDIKRMLGYDHSSKDMPEWLKDFAYSESNDRFVRRSTGNQLLRAAFDTSYATKCIFEDETFKPSTYATTVKRIPVVWDVMYYPAMHGDMEGSNWKMDDALPGPDFFKDEIGQVWLNTFDPDSIPRPAENLSKYDRKAISIMQDFFVVLFPNDKERGYVMDWMAFVIQNPTKRINYSLLVRGAHGSGKTTLGVIMTAMLGSVNVGRVSNTVMNGRFTDWAEGHILKIVEEIYDKGDRYSAVERQKEFITNDRFMVEAKGLSAKEAINTSSKMMFTNHFNALPLDENQRRYLVVSTQAENHLDMERVYGTAVERSKFFKDVYRAIENHAPAIKKWFMEWEISDSFDHKGHAPQDTEAFTVMADAANDGVAGSIAQMIREGDTYGVHRDIIYVPDLKNAFYDNEDLEMPKTVRLKNILMELGYKPAGVLKFEKKPGRVYVRKRVTGAFTASGKLDTEWAQKTLKKHNAGIEAAAAESDAGGRREDWMEDEV